MVLLSCSIFLLGVRIGFFGAFSIDVDVDNKKSFLFLFVGGGGAVPFMGSDLIGLFGSCSFSCAQLFGATTLFLIRFV